MKALFSLSRKAAEGDGDEQKQYKKANLGERNKFYYNTELQMWVEKGKEEEYKASKAATAAPPPVPTTMAPVADVAAANGNGPQPPAAQKYNRGLSIKDRYIAQPVGAVGGGGGSGPPSGRGLLPAAAAGGLMPGIPKPAGSNLVPRVGSFFMPTPTTSEAPSEPAGDSSTPGTMSVSQSGLSMDALVPGSGPPSQPGPAMPSESGSSSYPGFFVPSMPAATTAESGKSIGSSAASVGEALTTSAVQEGANGIYADRISSSGGGTAPAASSSQNLSFASWGNGSGSSTTNRSPQQRLGNAHKQQYTSGTYHIDADAKHPAKQQKQYPEQHPHSPGPTQLQQQQDNNHQQQAGPLQGAVADADSNGNAVHPHYAGHDVAAEYGLVTAAVGDDALATAGTQSDMLRGGWGLEAARDPLDLSAGIDMAESGAATPAAWGSYQPVAAEMADPESAGAAETGWANGVSSQEAEPNHPSVTDSAAALASSADGYTSSYGYGQQAVWDHPGTAQQAYGQYAGYGYAAGAEQQQQWPGYSPQQTTEDQGQYQQQGYPDANGYGHYGQGVSQYYQQPGVQDHLATGSAVAAVVDPAMHVMLDPVHPELPGIATNLRASASEQFEAPSSHHQQGPASAASAGDADAACRYQSAPGTAPQTSRATSGGLHGSLGSGLAPVRSSSLQPTHKGSVSSLLPPARPSFNGSVGSPPKDSSALTLPATAVAGDSSLVTTVRPSSPYARPVSPLARTNTGMSDLSTDSKAAAQGFPIPSPPTAGLGKPGMFMPGVPNGQAYQNTRPWRPSAPGTDAPVGDGNSSKTWQPGNQQQQPEDVLTNPSMTINGYVGPHYATADGPATISSSKEPWFATHHQVNAADSGPQDAAGKVKHSKRVHYYDEFLQNSIAQVNWKLHPFQQPGKLNKLTPIEKFEQEQERQKQQHRAKGKDTRDTAFYLKQMELRQKLPAGAKPSQSEPVVLPSHAAALVGPAVSTVSKVSLTTDWQQHRDHFGQQQQQQQQQGPGEPVTPQCAKSAGATAVAAEDGSPGETTAESRFVPRAADVEADSSLAAPGAAVSLAPAAAVVDGHAQFGNSYGVYDPLHHQQDQTVPAAQAGRSPAEPDEAAAVDETGAVAELKQQEPDAAAAWPAEWSLCTADMQQSWVQWCYPDYLPWLQSPEYQPWFEQQYNISMQQQQQQLAAEQPAGTAQVQQEPLEASAVAAGVAGSDLEPQQLEGWGTPELSPGKDGIAQTVAVTWDVEGAAEAAEANQEEQEEGQIDGVTGLQLEDNTAAAAAAANTQQLDEQAAAALEAAADGWGDENAVINSLPIPAESAAADAGNDVLAESAVAVAAIAATDVVEQAVSYRIARLSSSEGMASQPSTAKAAAAASKAIVSQAINSIISEQAESQVASAAEQIAGQVEAAVAGSDGWGSGWAAEELDLGDAEHRPAAAAAAVEVDAAVTAAAVAAAAVEVATAAGDGWCDGWVGSEVAVTDDGMGVVTVQPEGQQHLQQAVYDVTPGYPADWAEMRNLVAALPDLEGQLAECKQAFIGWGDVFFASVSSIWPAERRAADSATAAALEAKTAEMDQAIEMFSDLDLQQRPTAGVFGGFGVDIGDLLTTLEL